MRNLLTTLAMLLLPVALSSARAAAAPDGVAYFEQTIRPLLVSRCYECHATTAKKVKGDLLLDTKAGWTRGGEMGPVIVPGKPDESLLIQAVRYAHGDLKMPPKGKLPQAEIDALVQWVKLGAPDPREGPALAQPTQKKGMDLEAGKKLWSLQPLSHPAAPAVKDAAWCRTDIDRFILAKLEAKRIAPNGPIDRRKLIRRAYFDLHGLPPTPEEVDSFVADPDPAAYEKLIDRLLASPRYGERWASYWLDVVRFAESDGFEHDYDRPYAYHYRDFVIRALNDDLPFDRFAKWQLAGDEYEPDNPEAMMATGFLTAGVFPTQITEKEFESTRYNQLDDMVSTTGVAFLGLTIGCARCHDHKFDPIPTEDYYRLAATFTTALHSDVEMDLSTPTEKDDAKKAFEAKRAELAAKVEAFEREEFPSRFEQYLAAARQNGGVRASPWTVLDVTDVGTAGGTKFVHLPDGSLLKTGGDTPAKDTYTFTAGTNATGVTAVRLEALTHDSLPKHGPGLAANGNFVLGAMEITAAPADGSAKPIELNVAKATATHEQNSTDLSVAATFDEDPKTGWAVDNGGIGKDQAAVFELDKPTGFPGGTILTFRLRFEHPNKQHAIGRPRLSVTTIAPVPAPAAATTGEPPPEVAATLNALAKSEPVHPTQVAAAKAWLLTTLPEYQAMKASLAAHVAAGPRRKVVKVQVTSEGLPPVKNHADDRGYPHFYPQTYVLRRGDPNQKVEPATPSFLRVLMRDGDGPSRWQQQPPPGARTSYHRRALAEWLTDVDHGAGALAARVAANRLWQHHLGRGIVATPSDFGTRGAPPTHPELLGYLASQLVQNGWRLKPLHRQIMLSSTYQADSAYDPAKAAIDPEDELLWRRPVKRLESEAIRDAMLSVSRMLDTTLYGPGTLDPKSNRRSVYFTVKRSSLIPMMLVFDAPEALTPIANRSTTTIAPQALLLMNNPQVREYAKKLAARACPTASTPPATAIRSAYEIALSRPPTAEEVSDAVAFISAQAEAYKAAAKPDAAALALADFCQAVMCLNEFVYVD